MKAVVYLFLFFLFAGACKNVNDQSEYEKPNIIFIMSDDHAARAISLYNDELVQTPNIDKIGRDGAVFHNAFCTNSICAPSRATILTGKYSHRNGILDNRTPFDGSQETFPKLLREAGYQTALVGKWHLHSKPTGFNYWNILPGQGDYNDPVLIDNGDTIKHRGYVTDIITDLSLQWLENRDKSKPFCLLTHHKAVHTPNIPPEKYKKLFEDRHIPLPVSFYDSYKGKSKAASKNRIGFSHKRPNFPKHYRDLPDSIPDELYVEAKYQMIMKDYLSCVKSMDDNIGRIITYLEENKLTDNTILIYTSDQGFFLGEHGWFNKRFMYEESIKMPLVMQYPARIKPKTDVNEIILNLDFAPTLLDFAGIDIPVSMQGESFKDILLEEELDPEWRDEMYYHYYEMAFDMAKHYGVRTDRYKLIYFYEPIDEWEMYDLQNDPYEMNNIYNNAQYLQQQKMLKKKLMEQIYKYEDNSMPNNSQ